MKEAGNRERRRERRIRWAVRIGGIILRILASTWRVREVNGEHIRGLREKRQPFVAVFWHGEMLPLLWWHRGQGIAILVSEHGDGELISRVAARLGFSLVRGSTSRGAERSLLELTRVSSSGRDVAVSPDGPRGPAHSFAPGALLTAYRAGAPLLLVAASASRAWRLKSWDRFMIPRPFARVSVAYAPPQPVVVDSARDAAALAPRIREQLIALGESIGA